MQFRTWTETAIKGSTLGRMMFAICMAAPLISCSGDELTWTEDARLPDGRTVTLKRWVEFKGGSSHLGDPATESRQTFEFKHPETGEVVSWGNTIQQGTLSTIALWLDKGKPVLLAKPAYGGDYYKYNCPNPPYLLYEYAGARQWRSIPLRQIPFKRARANLTVDVLDRREYIKQHGRHLSAEQTSDSYAYYQGVRKVPYIIQFEGMPEQRFGTEVCVRPSMINDLLAVEVK